MIEYMKRRICYIVIPLFALVAILAGLACNPRAIVYRLAYHSPEVLYFSKTKEKVISLTIDDGPHPVVTPQILDVLDEFQVTATFFLIGERVEGNEALVNRMVAQGHEIGNHHMRDAPSIRLSEEEFEQQLLQAHTILSNYSTVKWFRPGSGWYNQRMLRQLEKHGYKCVLGSVYPYDTIIKVTNFLSDYILSNIFQGSIIVLHDGSLERLRTVKVLKKIIPKLKKNGYRFVTISQLGELLDHPLNTATDPFTQQKIHFIKFQE